MTEVAVLTRVKPGEGENLRDYLRGPDVHGRVPSPFAGLAKGTHLARFVVIETDAPHLLFTSRFDGDERAYLKALSERREAREMFERCVKPDPVSQASLLAHLSDDENQVPASYVVALTKPPETVERINDALGLQLELSTFAREAGVSTAADLAQAFWELPSVQRVLDGWA
ncbi:MAG TPA: hypothetical protein VHY83_15600 [Solirubrobacteraceae bacterium]|nr:hypothetical protein [Solirubrobacteraceae bacterium]